MRSRRSLLPGAALAAAVVALGATALFSTAAQAATPPGLHVSGTQLVEKDGTPFVARGVSHAHTWYTSQTATAIPATAPRAPTRCGSSCPTAPAGPRTTPTDVANIIALCKANKLICMLEDHDTTGYGEEGAAVRASTRAATTGSSLMGVRAQGPGGLHPDQHRQRAVRQQRHREHQVGG